MRQKLINRFLDELNGLRVFSALDIDKMAKKLADAALEVFGAHSLTPENLEKANKKVDMILENERKSLQATPASTWHGREKIPEPIRELLDAFVEVTGKRPTKGDLMDWLSTGGEWLEMNATPSDIRNAYGLSLPTGKSGGFTVFRPGSLTNAINTVIGRRRVNASSPINTVDRIAAQLMERR